MAIETITVDNGTGTDYDVQADDVGTNDYMQVVKLGEQTAGANTLAPGDANGLQVIPYVRKTRIAVTPTVTGGAYVADEQVGGKLTFASAARVSGGSGTVVNATITCRAATTVTPDLDLYLFEADPTIASVDNGTADITDANMESARLIGVLTFRTADYRKLSANTSCSGRFLDGQPALDFVLSGSSSLFGMLVSRAGFTLASTSDIVVALRILQD